MSSVECLILFVGVTLTTGFLIRHLVFGRASVSTASALECAVQRLNIAKALVHSTFFLMSALKLAGHFGWVSRSCFQDLLLLATLQLTLTSAVYLKVMWDVRRIGAAERK
jgi:hypothetical protein